MSFQEKKSIVSVFITLVIATIYSLIVFQKFGNLDPASANIFKFWATVLLIIIPVEMISKIIMYIIVSIIHKITTNEDGPDFMDERDKLIELKSTRNASVVFGLGFLLALGSQVIGNPPYTLFIIMLFTVFVADIFTEISQFLYYRRGV